jgi:aspartyl-tRNA synthetase
MVAGLERYYQIARCYRDEDFRADRQPEFTQLDIEMSFPDEEDLYELTEAVMSGIWREVLDLDIPTPFPRMTYGEAMRRFGVDRPDVRFGVELVDLTPYFAGTPFRVFQAPHVGAVVMPGGATQPRKTFDAWQEWAKQRGARGLAYVTFLEDGTLGGPVAKNLSDAERAGLREAVGAQVGDCAFFGAGSRSDALALLGATRLEVGRRLGLMDDSRWEFLWVTDFPMFEPDGSGGWTAVHHPFTAPAASHQDTFAQHPADVPARAYDLILNGTELGGGSIRIHSSAVQKRVFDVIGLTEEQASEQFGFLLEAFSYGPPPHGGIAFGIDRIAAMVTRSESIREVIAFPKTGGGGDPLTGAPTPITAQQRREAGIDGAAAPST